MIINLIKPKQILPIKIQEIIDFLNVNSKLYNNSVDIACDLLDLSSETKETLNNIIAENLFSKELTPKVYS
jgi:hypothetical protein